ncbi:MAG: hypothetical protein GX495_03320 [Chloroflexi bacterium]|jgi:hypothetical protein|nr:hypothetical protein [Chloroflexota bacterium]
MNSARLTQRVEIAFWNAAIQVMEEATALRRLIHAVYNGVDRFQKASWLKLIAFTAGTGLLLGFVSGYLVVVLR